MDELRLGASRGQSSRAEPPFHYWEMPDGSHWTQFYRTPTGYLLRFPELADFEVTADGAEVIGFPVPGVSGATIQHLYLNQVLPLVLSKRGRLVFHASAVELAEGAVAFVAGSGLGKSTLAAGFAVSGFRFLTDDGLVIDERDGVCQVLPSHPSIRLWSDSEEALIATGVAKAPAVDYTPKARLLAGDDLKFCDQPRPLRRAYFLGEGMAEQISIRPMTAAEALTEWVRHSYLLDVEERPRVASHFEQVSRLAREPIHFRLDFPRRFQDLPAVRRAIVRHAADPGVPA